ncbi:DUF4132 domain-containing protein [Nocardiopsis sp. RSe5-2]|uniref:DUF4132 domain-containing protein n=1 Tax=Nocardiopsis endophytica TaxID=3018445 RepID=A0ABT4TXJ0_9ACTN|nr:DUF4132 domain-containing protein [Nocardiopsis endophytica]MDA2809395.1 DUF4132 domain-containing protein [Nocardiopsis endophytica]
MGWIEVGDGGSVALRGVGRDAEPVYRGAQGRETARVPAKVKKDPHVAALLEVRSWLGRHDRRARERVGHWMLRSLPVPAGLLGALWPDPVWRRALDGLVVAPVTDDGPDLARCALLRDADTDKGASGVGLDREPVRLDADRLLIVHPVLLGDDLNAWWLLARSLGAEQGTAQLGREVWRRPPGMDRSTARLRVPRRFEYEQGWAFEKQVIALGGRIRGESARFSVTGDARGGEVGLTVDLRWQGPEAMVSVDAVSWSCPGERIDDTAWSEGVRTLMELYRARTAADHGDPEPEELYEAACEERTAADADRAVGSGIAPAPRTRASVLADPEGVVPGRPADGDGSEERGEDALVACRFVHPALDEPVVVTAPRSELDADRAALSVLGLVPAGETPAGAVRTRPPGFLARALDRHPARRDLVVGLLPELRASAELASTKPGRARDAMLKTAARLEAQAPELLTLFYDECAAVQARVGSDTYAAGFFKLAREAESQGHHPVDEAEVVDAYLGFPLGDRAPGTLKAHAAALAARLAPGPAHAWQRRLATAWSEAGSPASGHLATGLKTLAQAAGRTPGASGDPDEDRADARAVRALAEGGSLEQAGPEVWEFFGPLLGAEARSDPAFLAVLATRLPEPARDSAKARTAAAGALVGALAGTGSAAPFTDSGVSGPDVLRWLNGFLARYSGMTPPVDGLEDLLRDAGARLRAEGLECEVHRAMDARPDTLLDLGLVSLLLSCGVPVAPPRAVGGLRLAGYLDTARGPDLSAMAADPVWGALLREAVDGNRLGTLALGRPHENPAPGGKRRGAVPVSLSASPKAAKALTKVPGAADTLAGLLRDHADRAVDGGLPDLYTAVRDIDRFTLHGAVPAWVKKHARAVIAAADPAHALATALRGGLLDELALPHLAGAVGPGAALLESGPDLILTEYPSGDLRRDALCRSRAVLPDRLGPETVLPFAFDRATTLRDTCFAVVGDAVVAAEHGGPHCPHDPADVLPPTRHPEARTRPPAEAERVRFPGADGEASVHRVGARQVELRDADGRAIGRYRVGSVWVRHNGIGLVASGLITTGPLTHRYAAGTGLVLPPGWWSRMSPRDEAGSRALRAADDALARRLLDTVHAGLAARIIEATDADALLERAERAALVHELAGLVRAVLPEVTDERLLLGVAAAVWTAAECRDRLVGLAERLKLPAPANAGTAPAAPPGASAAVPADAEGGAGAPGRPGASGARTPLTVDVPAARGTRSSRAAAYARIAELGPRAAALPAAPYTPVAEFDAEAIGDGAAVVGRLGRAALRAAWSPHEAARASAVDNLRDLAETPAIAAADGTWRMEWRSRYRGMEPNRAYALGGGAAFLLDRHWHGIGSSASRIAALVHTSSPGPGRGCWGDALRLSVAADLVEDRGPAPHRAAGVRAFSEATGVPLAQAAVLLSPFADFRVPASPPVNLPWEAVWRSDADHFTELGLSETEVGVARTALLPELTGGDEHDALIEALVPADPVRLWDVGPDTGAAVRLWLDRHPRWAPVPDAMWRRTQADRAPVRSVAGLLSEGRPLRAEDIDGAGRAAVSSAYRAPAGAPAALVASRIRELRALCTDPAVLVRVGTGVRSVRRVEDTFGAGVRPLDDGALAVTGAVRLTPGGDGYDAWLAPAALDGGADPRLDSLKSLLTPDPPQGRRGPRPVPPAAPPILDEVRFLLSDGSARLADEVGAASGWRQDPLVSAPGLVAEVAEAEQLSEDAARLYLQVIALPDPADADVCVWNGWEEDRRAAAAEELGGDLVVTGTDRPRSGRTLFAPGGWSTSPVPGGVETAKLHGLPGAAGMLARHLPTVPMAELFSRAWHARRGRPAG